MENTTPRAATYHRIAVADIRGKRSLLIKLTLTNLGSTRITFGDVQWQVNTAPGDGQQSIVFGEFVYYGFTEAGESDGWIIVADLTGWESEDLLEVYTHVVNVTQDEPIGWQSVSIYSQTQERVVL